MFRYYCTKIDENELRVWIFNHGLIAETPEFYRQEVIFINSLKLVNVLVMQYVKLGLTIQKGPGDAAKLPIVYKEIKDHVLGTKIDRLIDVLYIFKSNNGEGLIGERELRRVLFEYLEEATDHHITTIICSLRYTKPPDDSNLF